MRALFLRRGAGSGARLSDATATAYREACHVGAKEPERFWRRASLSLWLPRGFHALPIEALVLRGLMTGINE